MATIKDVATLAGVSSATVSNVLNGTKNVSKERRARVQQAVKELHYQPDYIASSLKKKQIQAIGVIVTSLKRIFYSQMISGITSVASQNNYKLIFYASENDILNEMKYVDMLANSRVDGILLDTLAEEEKHADYLKKLKNLNRGNKQIPVISLERNLVKYGIRSVHVNNRLGGQIATEHLVQQGCRRIAFVSGPMSIGLIQDRYNGYQDILHKYGISPDRELIYAGDYSPTSGYQAVNRFVSEGIDFDSIFACNDEMAIGTIRALKEAHMKIPEDIKVIGFDNTFVSSLVDPSISTINVPKFRMGSCAAQMLIDHLNGTDRETCTRELGVNLTVRSSTDAGIQTVWDLDTW